MSNATYRTGCSGQRLILLIDEYPLELFGPTRGVAMIRFSLLLSSGMLFGSLVGQCLAQEAHVRQQAQTLLERANSLSVPRQFHSYEQTIIFQSSSPTGVREGRFTSVVQGPYLYRDEYEFGDYRLLVVGNEDMVAEVGDRSRAPVEIRRVARPFTPRKCGCPTLRGFRRVGT